MRTTKKWIIVAAALPMVFATASAFAFGKDGQGMRCHGGQFGGIDRGLLRQLDLTEEQKDQFRDMRDAIQDEMQAKREANRDAFQIEMKAHQLAIQDLVLADTFDQSKAEELAKAMVQKQTVRRVEMLAQRHEMLSILTDVQKKELKDLQANCIEQMSDRMGKGRYK